MSRTGFLRVISAAFLSCLSAGASADEPQVRYDNYRVIEASPRSVKEFLALQQIADNLACIPAPSKQQYLVAPDAMDAIKELGVPFIVKTDNAQDVLDAERRLNDQALAERGTSFFTAYHTLAEVNAYMDQLAALRPDLVTIVSFGKSFEGRPLRAMRITGAGGLGSPTKPGYVITACQHAREWVSLSTSMYVADQLVRNYGVDPQLTAMVDNVNWWIVPVSNPDGYLYTWTNNRLWRKNRRPNNDGTYGVDLNRNWGFHWGGSGSSGMTNSETYRGAAPFSEPETTDIAAFMQSLPNLKGTIDLHSYSQVVLGPWGYTTSPAPRQFEVNLVQNQILSAVEGSSGTDYEAGPASTTLYLADGVILDWTFGVLGMLSWTIELRDTGQFGFELPPAQILPTAIEAFAGIKVLAQHIQQSLIIDVTPVPLVDDDTPTNVAVTVQALNNLSIVPGTAKLHYRVGSAGAFSETLLSGAGPDYTAVLPAFACGSTVEYYASAQASNGTVVTDPADAPGSVLTTTVGNIALAFDDTVESGVGGWTVNPQGNDTATAGRWERADPQATTSQPEDDHTAAPGTFCWVTDGRAGSSAGTYDLDGGRTTLQSPLYNLADYSSAKASFWLWYDNNNTSTSGEDVFRIELSNNDGADWSPALTIGPAGKFVQGGWFLHEIALENVLPLTSSVRLRFIADDTNPGDVVEAALDDIQIVGSSPCTPPPICTGDTNGDQQINGADLSVLLGSFGATVVPGSGADFNGDGHVNAADLSVLLARFGTSC